MVKVMKKKTDLHSKHIVHGDLRFSNIVFSESSAELVTSTIIDFDYSGVADEQIYPMNYNREITDGSRHGDANETELLRYEHDVFAVQWMCAQFRPKKKNLRELWSKCVDDLMSNLQDVIQRLEQMETHAELEPVNDKLPEIKGIIGTGSPIVERRRYK